MEAMKDYVAHLDNKKRITLRGASCKGTASFSKP